MFNISIIGGQYTYFQHENRVELTTAVRFKDSASPVLVGGLFG
jgi:hypothetical protein